MSFGFSVKEAVSGFRKQTLSILGSIFTVTIALILLGLYYLVAVQLSSALRQIRSQVDVEVFVRSQIGKNALLDLQNQIRSMEGIAGSEYVSKEEAAEIFKAEFGEDISRVLEDNPLPPSFKITLKDSYRTSAAVERLQKNLKALKGVDDVVYRKDMLQFFDERTYGINMIGLTLGIFFALGAIILVANSIRLTIVARKQSIQIMKLVGATPWFIRSPLLLEGMLIGFVGSIFAAGLLLYFVTSMKTVLPQELTIIALTDIKFYGFIVGTGILLGFAGAAISARKYIGESVL